jgi:hypothetical protein
VFDEELKNKFEIDNSLEIESITELRLSFSAESPPRGSEVVNLIEKEK